MYQGPEGQHTPAALKTPVRLAHAAVPVFSEASVIDFMAFCAKTASCLHEPFSQGAIEGLDSSCYGLSLFWLNKRKYYPALWNRLKFATTELAAPMHKQAIRAIHTQQIPHGDVASPILLTQLRLQYDEKYKELNSMDAEEFINFFKWIFSAFTPRYYLLESRHHYMALSVSYSSCQFFDPNGGIVHARDTSAMQTFLTAYLSNQKLRRYYGSQQRLNLIRLTAHKFK